MHIFKPLPRAFYVRSTLSIAREIPGLILCRRFERKLLAARIVEVEAYLGHRDPASHAYRLRTERNEVMFWTGGHLYVYFTYGMHYCANIVTEREERGMAVLLRAGEPIRGLNTMMTNRYGTREAESSAELNLLNGDLCRGPAKLCRSFGIDRRNNGTDLCGNEIWLARDASLQAPFRVRRSTRIGITQGKEHRWRFFIADSPFVSRLDHS